MYDILKEEKLYLEVGVQEIKINNFLDSVGSFLTSIDTRKFNDILVRRLNDGR